ncbi:hypothetical protein CCAX7_22400 [Capsulimonas corticalis]|uniref:DUF6968 domain-containing protein n=1 Tax=Capsulimonas corticalis TaxID=2219043 RepID=A0A402D272_9BACT|nr:hypothetical protein [Capsulimonas corticalis]BDI30189.1 hypothetical protein CCAX7_22400 [Capsulimonas corticalis]
MSEIIAERIFDLNQDGIARNIRISMEKPCRCETGQDWVCHIVIETPDEVVKRPAYGVDSYQALEIGLSKMQVLIENLALHYRGEITLYGSANIL